MKRFKVITIAKWECETEEEALEIFDPECYDNYDAEFVVEEVEE